MAVDRGLAASFPVAARSLPALRRAAVFAIAAITLLLVLGAGAAGVGATAVDPYGDELMRLTNADRGALGKPALTIDPTLASFARDLSWTCPTNGALVVRGRAADMADRGYFSHSVAGCLAADGTDMSVLDVMSDVLGYRVMRGENIAWNNYGTETASYAYGCAIDGTGCTGTTSTPKTVEVAERGFMQSSGHRANILNTYDRFGCGSALAADGHRYYACVFSLGGPAPTPTPDPTPTTAPTPTPDPITTPTPSPVPALAPAPKPTPVRDIHVPAVVSATGAGTIRVGSSRRVTAIVTDNLALARLELRVDGRLTKAWSLRGTRAWRATVIASWRLRVGHHLVRWTVRDRAGHVRSRSIWIVVRR